MKRNRNLWPLLIAAGTLLFYGCSPPPPDYDVAGLKAELAGIKAELADTNAELKKIADKRLFPLGEKGEK